MVSRQDRRHQRFGQRRLQQPVPAGPAGLLQRRQIAGIQACQQGAQAGAQSVGGNELAIGGGGGGKTARHLHPFGRQLADHLAEGGVLAADIGDRLDTDALKGHHQNLRIQHGCAVVAV